MAELIVEPIQTAELESSGYIGQPEGNIDLTENNVQVNVAPYKYATPKIPIQEDVPAVDPSTQEQIIEPAEGFAGLKKVTVNPANLEIKQVNPTTEEKTIVPQTPAIGFSQFTVEPVTPSIDPDIQPENIKQGVDILGVQGTLKPPTLITKQITENGTYAAEDDNADGYSEVAVDVDQQRLLDDYLSMTTATVSSDITYLRPYAFAYDTTIKNVSFPLCVSCGERPFLSSNIEIINMPKLNMIGSYFAPYCEHLHTVNFDSLKLLAGYSFGLSYNGALEQDIVFSFPNLERIGPAAFQYRKKVTVILGSICQLPNVNAFSNQAKIYAHQTDIDNYYSTATNWSVLYANGQIYPIEGSEYE